uniref:Integrase catalytic domain-containing protein n=1 Tax=Tanacetum cinerariifolium TaxID=118510 RepID=A0A6L2NTD3_TANCI|nr:hypothetical protein [Tanacetum cinerariifolium]
MALGYQNPFYLKQAQQKQHSLYNGKVLLEKHDPPVVHDSEESLKLQLAQESRLKMKQLNKEIKPANYTKINHLSGVFVSQMAKSREELYFSNTSKTANVSKPVSIPNEEFSDDSTPSVARKFLNKVSEQKDTIRGTSANTKFAKQSILGKPPSSSSRTKLYAVSQISKSTVFLKVIAPGMFRIIPFKPSREEKYVPNKVRASVRTNPITMSQTPVIIKKIVNSDSNGLSSTGVDNIKTKRPHPRSNTKNDRVPSASKSSCSMNKEVEVKEHPRNLLLSKNKKHMSSECNKVKLATQNVKSKVVCAMCKQYVISINHDVCLLNYVNDTNSSGKKQKAKVSINKNQKKQKPKVKKHKKVGSIERLASPKPSKPRSFLRWSPTGRLFDLKGKIIASSESESQSDCFKGYNACTSNPLEPTIKRFPNSSFSLLLGTVRFRNDHIAAILGFGDLQWGNILITRVYFVEGLGVDLLSRNHTTNLYTINLHEMASASPICLMACASSTKSWLWQQCLSHLNFDTVNDLAKNDLFTGLPKFKYHKKNLYPSCEQRKSKRASHPRKPVPNSRQRLHLLYMDLCGPMRIASINGKRTDNESEFKNQVLKEYFESVGISHQVSSIQTPQQNKVVERRNRMLVEAARTMIIFSRAPLFLWAEAIATACFTQNRSIIHLRFKKTPYELINGRKPDISFLHVFGTLCYPKNDREDIGKLGAKGDISFFIGYYVNSCAYRVYNRRTKKIIETMNVTFDELSAIAFEQSRSKPRLQSMTSRQISSGLDLTYAPSTITTQPPTEGELDLLFKDMYDDYIGGQPSAVPRTVPAAQATQDVDGLNTQQQYAQQQGNQAPLQSETVAENVSNAMFDENTSSKPCLQVKEGSIWVKASTKGMVYVDDIIFGSTHPRYTQLFSGLLKSRFEISMMREMTFFLGLQVNQSPCGIFINQSNYVLEILKKYGIESCDPVGTPMEIKDKLDLDQNGTPVDATKYCTMIGSLMYLTSSRPDIVHATCLCARFQAKPTEKHLKEATLIASSSSKSSSTKGDALDGVGALSNVMFSDSLIFMNFLKSLTAMTYYSSSLPEVELSSSLDSFLAFKARDFLFPLALTISESFLMIIS